eukprot:CAMPEP_0178403444 /NCGR_PEP_ID=MMETSP0689_2-20121128/17372_1 /TAXON_ID=160604 /ORGANISM="Amphidinium massartii, Strain CS-259" /LENGTH=258 /DNA_ID=CAMNT_0020024399 /DNA_START=739 /DNA_END=1513 /DNA_ORIENTATION=+
MTVLPPSPHRPAEPFLEIVLTADLPTAPRPWRHAVAQRCSDPHQIGRRRSCFSVCQQSLACCQEQAMLSFDQKLLAVTSASACKRWCHVMASSISPFAAGAYFAPRTCWTWAGQRRQQLSDLGAVADAGPAAAVCSAPVLPPASLSAALLSDRACASADGAAVSVDDCESSLAGALASVPLGWGTMEWSSGMIMLLPSWVRNTVMWLRSLSKCALCVTPSSLSLCSSKSTSRPVNARLSEDVTIGQLKTLLQPKCHVL